MLNLNPDDLRKRFHELGSERERVIAAAKPKREAYEAILAQSEAIKQQLRKALDELKPLEQPIFGIDQERALISRVLGHRTGEPG